MSIISSRSRQTVLDYIAGDEEQQPYGYSGQRDDHNYPADDDQPPEDYLAFTSAMWDEQDGPLEPLQQAWIQNLLFLSSLQWWERDRLGKWHQKRGPEWRRWPVTNLVLPYFQHFLAKATKQRPAWIAIPSTPDPDDIHAARLAEDVLEAKWTELRMAKKLRRCIAWTIVTGNGYLLPYWNEDTGKMKPKMVEVRALVYDQDSHEAVGETILEVPADREGTPMLTAEGLYDPEGVPFYYDEGEVGVKALSPFQVRVDPGADEDEDIRWFIVAETVPIRDLNRSFPTYAGQFVQEDTSNLDRYEALLSGVGGLGMGADTQTVSGMTDAGRDVPKALVYHYHERPCEEYPQGRYWCVTAGVLLQEPGPLPDELWPCLVHIKDIEIPGRYYGASKMEAVIGLNREYNECNQQILEHHQLLLRGKWLVPIGSQIRKGQITQEPGEVIQHTPGMAPTQAAIQPLPVAIYQERERIKSDFQMVTGINRISMGQPPSGLTSGRAFLVLQEADDTDLGPFLEQLESAVADLAHMMLKIMQIRYTDERLLRTTGAERSYKIRAFRGADLAGVADVVPQTGSSFPWSQTAKQSALIDLLQTVPDLFLDPETGMLDRERLSRALPIAGIGAGYASSDEDYNEVMREEDVLAAHESGEPLEIPQLQPWQNHVFHRRSHARTLKTAGFREWSPEAQQAFVQHYMETEQQLQDMAMAAKMAEAEDAAMMQEIAGGEQGMDPGGPGVAQEPMSPEEKAAAREQMIAAEEEAVDAMAEDIASGREPE